MTLLYRELTGLAITKRLQMEFALRLPPDKRRIQPIFQGAAGAGGAGARPGAVVPVSGGGGFGRGTSGASAGKWK